MSNKNSLKNVEKLLKKHNQSHLLAFWGQLDDNQRQNLLAQINELDFYSHRYLDSAIYQNNANGSFIGKSYPAAFLSCCPGLTQTGKVCTKRQGSSVPN